MLIYIDVLSRNKVERLEKIIQLTHMTYYYYQYATQTSLLRVSKFLWGINEYVPKIIYLRNLTRKYDDCLICINNYRLVLLF